MFTPHPVTHQVSVFFKVMELFGGGSVINGAYPDQLLYFLHFVFYALDRSYISNLFDLVCIKFCLFLFLNIELLVILLFFILFSKICKYCIQLIFYIYISSTLYLIHLIFFSFLHFVLLFILKLYIFSVFISCSSYFLFLVITLFQFFIMYFRRKISAVSCISKVLYIS